jgi:hypothetical protein
VSNTILKHQCGACITLCNIIEYYSIQPVQVQPEKGRQYLDISIVEANCALCCKEIWIDLWYMITAQVNIIAQYEQSFVVTVQYKAARTMQFYWRSLLARPNVLWCINA